MLKQIVLCALGAFAVGCGQMSGPSGTVAAQSQSSVEVSYDAVRNVTYATLTFSLPGSDGETAAVYWSADGDVSPPLPAESLRECVSVYGVSSADFAILADGDRFLADVDRYDEYCIGPEALRAMATAADVQVSVGHVSGPLPAESKRAIAEYLALFQ